MQERYGANFGNKAGSRMNSIKGIKRKLFRSSKTTLSVLDRLKIKIQKKRTVSSKTNYLLN